MYIKIHPSWSFLAWNPLNFPICLQYIQRSVVFFFYFHIWHRDIIEFHAVLRRFWNFIRPWVMYIIHSERGNIGKTGFGQKKWNSMERNKRPHLKYIVAPILYKWRAYTFRIYVFLHAVLDPPTAVDYYVPAVQSRNSKKQEGGLKSRM